jgi:hypothetical protein
MLNNIVRSSIIVGCIATLAVIATVSVAMDAKLSTTALLLALGVAPAIVMVLMKIGAPAPTVAQILHTVESTDSRS